jgi:GNAT superfamily N-acetyltransferase
VAPDVLPADWEDIRQARNLREGGALIKYAAPIENLALSGASDLRIAPVTENDAEAWAAILQESFGFPEEGSRGLFAASVGNPQFHPYGAWDGDTIVGGGNLFIKDDIASLNAGAVSSTHRRLGAQSALIAARIAKARELGCQWVTAETFQRPEGESDSSMNNILRAGLKVIYARQSWIWESGE